MSCFSNKIENRYSRAYQTRDSSDYLKKEGMGDEFYFIFIILLTIISHLVLVVIREAIITYHPPCTEKSQR